MVCYGIFWSGQFGTCGETRPYRGKKFQLLEGGYGHHPRPLSSNVKTVKEIQK